MPVRENACQSSQCPASSEPLSAKPLATDKEATDAAAAATVKYRHDKGHTHVAAWSGHATVAVPVERKDGTVRMVKANCWAVKSNLVGGLPPRADNSNQDLSKWRHEPDSQIAHKPRRRQRKTVAGWTMIGLRCQFAHQRDRNNQNSRSLGRKHGRRVPVRYSTAS